MNVLLLIIRWLSLIYGCICQGVRSFKVLTPTPKRLTLHKYRKQLVGSTLFDGCVLRCFVTIGSRALSFSDPYIHFACLSVLLSVRNFGAKYLGNEAR